jgi:hypothetical protein
VARQPDRDLAVAGHPAGMTACTDRHYPAPDCGVAGEGQKGMPKEAQP